MTEHLARHQLEEMIGEEASAALPGSLQAHLASCDHCTARRRAFAAAKGRYLAALPAPEFARAVIAEAGRPEPAARGGFGLGRWGALLAPHGRSKLRPQIAGRAARLAVLAAAAALFWIGQPPPSSEIRLKGGASLWAVAKHASAQRMLRDGDALEAGDQIAFEYALDRPRFLLLLGIDDGAAVTRYFPAANASAGRLAATTRTQLPVGIELDARAGEERLYALFSDAPLDEIQARRALVRALSETRAGPGGSVARMGDLDLPAVQISIWFRKP